MSFNYVREFEPLQTKGSVTEWLKVTDCKSVDLFYVSSNLTAPNKYYNFIDTVQTQTPAVSRDTHPLTVSQIQIIIPKMRGSTPKESMNHLKINLIY